MNKNKTINININFGTVVKISLFLILLFLLYEFKQLVLVILAAIVLSSAIEPIIRRLQKMKIPRLVSVLLVYILIIFFIAMIFILFAPSLMNQIDNLIKEIPNYIESSRAWLDTQIDKGNIFSQVFSNLKFRLGELSIISAKDSFDQNAGTIKDLLITFFGGIFNFFLILILSFYFALQEHGIANFLKIVTPVKYNKYILNLWKRTEKKIARWMQGQFILGFFIGLITYLGLKIFFNFEESLLLGVLAGITELIPIVGPLIAAIPALIIGYSLGGSSILIGVLIFYLSVQLIENNFVYPLVVKKIVGVPSFLVIISLLIGFQLFGFLGVILSVPVAAGIMEFIKDVEKKQLAAIKKGEEKEHPTLF